MFIAYLVGVVFGTIITRVLMSIGEARGKLKIDSSNPEKDTYRLEIDNLDEIRKKRYIRLRIVKNVDLSQD